MTTPVFGSSSAEPPNGRTGGAGGLARPPGRKAVGILLAPVTGRAAALAIVGLPLAIFLIIGFETNGGGSSAASGVGQSPFAGQTAQSQPVYPVTSPAYPTDTGTANSDAAGFGAASAADSSTADATDTPSDSASDSASASASPSPSPSATGPASVVLAAYDYVNKHEYGDAYNLGLARNGETYQTFVAGFSTTRSDTVTIGEVNGDVVSVSLVAVLTDGSQHTYSGTYTVAGQHIIDANLQQVN